MLKPLKRVRSRVVVLPDEHIDTDRIIPARFLTTTVSDGLGRHAFADWRQKPDCPLNDPRATGGGGAEILVTGRNFGCGSSREHAAWALADMGVRVVIASEIADIFRLNAGRNGILAAVAPPEHVAELMRTPFQEIEVDLEARTIRPAGEPGAFAPLAFEIDPFTRRCLLDGVDQMGFLLNHMDAIRAFDQQLEGDGACVR